jgi:hypothetical protein
MRLGVRGGVAADHGLGRVEQRHGLGQRQSEKRSDLLVTTPHLKPARLIQAISSATPSNTGVFGHARLVIAKELFLQAAKRASSGVRPKATAIMPRAPAPAMGR